jgi:GH15 family glucan-1,4-alpha-glucosidase
MEWVRRLSISYDWQDAIIRAAIALKLSNFEETGGIVAALTTSIPEAPGSGRTWDYRYCWLRDAYFVVKALNRLGATKTMEGFISFILGIASEDPLRPVYSVVPTDPMDEIIAPNLNGYRNDGPVRIGNAAVHQRQHDTFGSIILAAMPMFFDRRLPQETKAYSTYWNRSVSRRQSLPSRPTPASGNIAAAPMSTPILPPCVGQAAAAAAIASHLGLHDRAAQWAETASNIQSTLLEQAWSEKRGSFTAGFGLDDLDSSVLLLPETGVIGPNDPRFIKTVAAIERELCAASQ